MARGIDTTVFDLAEQLLSDIPGCTPEDIATLACDLQDAFENAANAIEERTEAQGFTRQP